MLRAAPPCSTGALGPLQVGQGLGSRPPPAVLRAKAPGDGAQLESRESRGCRQPPGWICAANTQTRPQPANCRHPLCVTDDLVGLEAPCLKRGESRRRADAAVVCERTRGAGFMRVGMLGCGRAVCQRCMGERLVHTQGRAVGGSCFTCVVWRQVRAGLPRLVRAADGSGARKQAKGSRKLPAASQEPSTDVFQARKLPGWEVHT